MYPYIIWEKEFENDNDKLKEKVLAIHRLLDNNYIYNYYGGAIPFFKNYQYYNANYFENNKYEIIKSQLYPNGYINGTTTYHKDHHFFYAPFSKILSEASINGISYSIDLISEKAIQKKSKKNANKIVDFATSKINEIVKSQGYEGADFQSNFGVPDSEELLKKELISKDTVEIVLSKLIEDSIRAFNVDECLNKDTLKHKLINNIQCAKIITNANDTFIQSISPEDVCFIGKRNAKSDEDIDCIQITQTIRITDAFVKYGHLKSSTNKDIDFHDCYCEYAKIKNDSSIADEIKEHYINMLSDAGFIFNTDSIYATEREMFFNVIKPIYGKLYYNDKRLNKKEIELYKSGNFSESEEVLVEEGTEHDYDLKTEKAELWRSVCIGNNSIVHLAKYHTQIKSKTNPNNIQFPIILEINDTPSLLDIGKWLYEIYASVMRILETEICIGGGKILNVDMRYKPETLSNEEYIALIQHRRVNAYNGNNLNEKQQYDYKHLSSTDLGLGDDIIRLIDLATTLRSTYYSIIGVQYDNLLIQRQGEKAQQEGGKSFIAENSISYLILDEHNKFIAKCLDKLKNFGWGKWIKNNNKLARCGIVNKEDINEIKEYNAVDDIGLYISSNISDQHYANMVKSHIKALAATSGIGLEEVIKLSGVKNEKDALRIYNEGFGSMKNIIDNQRKLVEENDNLKKQLEQANLLPLQIADMKGKYAIEIEKMRLDRDMQKQGMINEFKENKTDIDNNNSALMQERLMQINKEQLNNENAT